MTFKIQNNVRVVSVLDANWTNKFSLSWGTLRFRSWYNNIVVLHNNWLKILASLVMSFWINLVGIIVLSKQFFQFLPRRVWVSDQSEAKGVIIVTRREWLQRAARLFEVGYCSPFEVVTWQVPCIISTWRLLYWLWYFPSHCCHDISLYLKQVFLRISRRQQSHQRSLSLNLWPKPFILLFFFFDFQ